MVPPGVIAFPPRNQSLDFLNTLDAFYRDELNRTVVLSYIDLEGKAVWLQEYLRYRVNACNDSQATNRVFQQILGGGIAPVPCGPPSDDTVVVVTGQERLDWMQLAPSLDTLRSYEFALYVDGARQVLADPRCDAPPAGTQQYDCTAPLPALALGRHVLELSTSVVVDSTLLESPRSDPLVIDMVGGGGALQPVGPGAADEKSGPRRGLGLVLRAHVG